MLPGNYAQAASGLRYLFCINSRQERPRRSAHATLSAWGHFHVWLVWLKGLPQRAPQATTVLTQLLIIFLSPDSFHCINNYTNAGLIQYIVQLMLQQCLQRVEQHMSISRGQSLDLTNFDARRRLLVAKLRRPAIF